MGNCDIFCCFEHLNNEFEIRLEKGGELAQRLGLLIHVLKMGDMCKMGFA